VTLMLTLPMCTLDSSGIARSEIQYSGYSWAHFQLF
jgi:hypothetical protein